MKRGESPVKSFKFCRDDICNEVNSLRECQKPAFLTCRKLRFSRGSCPRNLYVFMQKAILPHQNKTFYVIILTNQLKTIGRPHLVYIPSNVVNIFYKNNYVCSFLKLPKFLSRFSFFLKRLLCKVSLYRQCLSSAYGHAESLFCLVMAFFSSSFFFHKK